MDEISGALRIRMDRYARVYILIVAALAIVFVAGHLLPAELDSSSWGPWEDVLAFIFVGILSQAAAMNFGRDRQSSSSMAFIPFLASAILLPPLGSVLVAAAVSA